MAERTLPGIGLTAYWPLGSDNWKDGMDANLFLLSIVGQLVVKSFVAALPGSPVDGDVHVLTTTEEINVRDDGVWKTIEPKDGWIAYNLEDDTLYIRADGEWTEFSGGGASLPDTSEQDGKYLRVKPDGSGLEWAIPSGGGGGGGGIEEAPEDGKLYARRNGTWVEFVAFIPGDATSSTQWRIRVQSNNGGVLCGFAEIRMYETIGGSNVATTGTASSSSNYGGTYLPARGNNNALNDRFLSSTAEANSVVWALTFPVPRAIIQFDMIAWTGEQEYMPRNFVLEAYTAGAWNVIGTYVNQTGWSSNQVRTFNKA